MSLLADVDRGLEIVALMEKLKAELEAIEERLRKEALNGPQVDLVDADREGKQFLATGSSHIVPVILTADKIMGEFAAKGPKRAAAEAAAHGHLLQFYKPVNKFENKFDSGKKFRALADELLGENAPAFITACIARDKFGIAKSDIKVTWKEATAS